ncbi:DUF2130 domain-containing protein [Helicobacter suis]|uniref:DUF2130 domain-containing protein n=1 Tax=Helicobacter suis TaxID=104628 RepID=UPI0013D6B18D|nr:DUF2130 domain-containing protein [Helicobacter suis]
MQNLICPHCHKTIDASDFLAEEKTHFEQEVQAKRQEYKQAFKNLEEKKKALDKQVQEGVARALEKERQELYDSIRMKVKREQEEALALLQRENTEKSNQLKEMHTLQAENEKLKRDKEEMRAAIEAQSAAQLNTQLQQLKERLQADYEIKLQEKEEQINQLKQSALEIQKRAESTSQQLQGEAQERVIEEYLRVHFPLDSIEDIKKGQRGADCLHKVYTRQGLFCGTICYESKNTKNFNKEWVVKLKEDMQVEGAEVGVLVSAILPKEMERMGLFEGVYVCTFEEFKALSVLLRAMVERIALVQKSQEDKADKAHSLYHYLTSTEFNLQIQGIVENFMQMQEDLRKEKQAMQKHWAKQEKRIDQILSLISQTYGSLEGIAGLSMPALQALEFKQ